MGESDSSTSDNECETLYNSIISLKNELAVGLLSHLNCDDGQRDILNPSGTDISFVPMTSLSDKIPELFSHGVKRWCESHVTRTKIDKIDGSIEEFLIRVTRDIAEVKGFSDTDSSPSLSEVVSSDVHITPVSLPKKVDGTGKLMQYIISIIWPTASRIKDSITKEVYAECLKCLTLETLKKSFHDSYAGSRCVYLEQKTNEYLIKLEDFEKDLKVQIETIRINQDNLLLKRTSLNKNIQRIEEIKCALDL